ncbi:tryptophan halogenase family protein [Sphingomonas sp. NFR15]|uniref:tryptophan halogenase family protein n=1 Tax=Sphingomonas sp. NFR15 TaxID=1566282 RepID=UPI0008818E23|nr:tryptophan halogenase family protein [Sphingomonas sp. NFR15]SDA20987.1 tryptophan halogenase [Sphingomonas sp. NFR15]
MNHAQTIRRVVIAGGGTAGWVAAAALSKHLGALLDIVLVESDEIGTVGVGEATIPTIRTFHRFLELDERDFMRATQATFKLGIAFENWARRGDRYVHGFGRVGQSIWMGDFQHMWLRGREAGIADDLGAYCLELAAAEAGKFATSDTGRINYAYHFDASLYAGFLRRFSEARGVTRLEGRIGGVRRNADTGDIEALYLADGREVAGDLFVDCTGFRGMLIEQTLKAGYEDWSHWLPTNRALAVQTTSVAPAVPYTRAIAHDAGWQWQIPLQHRVGNGLVYCSEYLSDDAAETTLRAQIQGEPITEPRLIRFVTGRRKRVWDHNCVALGLASGFVEPLESTSIHLIMIGVTRLIQSFPFGGIKPSLVKHYNDLAQAELERVRDFIILHYHLNQRGDDPFWERCRTMAIPDTLAQRIALFRESAMTPQTADDLFQADSWLQVMLGQRLEPTGYHRMGHMLSVEHLRRAFADVRDGIAGTVARMPTHHEFLEQYCAA